MLEPARLDGPAPHPQRPAPRRTPTPCWPSDQVESERRGHGASGRPPSAPSQAEATWATARRTRP